MTEATVSLPLYLTCNPEQGSMDRHLRAFNERILTGLREYLRSEGFPVVDIELGRPQSLVGAGSPLVKTVKSHPNHTIIGHYFRGPRRYDPNGTVPAAETFFCVQWDPEAGFTMRPIDGGADRIISETAVGRTFHAIEEWEFPRYGLFDRTDREEALSDNLPT